MVSWMGSCNSFCLWRYFGYLPLGLAVPRAWCYHLLAAYMDIHASFNSPRSYSVILDTKSRMYKPFFWAFNALTDVEFA